MTPEVIKAIDEIKNSFLSSKVEVKEDGSGGAFIVVDPVQLNTKKYKQSKTWAGFQITHAYPYADVYPHFVCSELQRKDKQPLGQGLTTDQKFDERPAIQVSRKSPQRKAELENAAIKLLKVIEWLNQE